MAKYLVRMDERSIVTYLVEADSQEDAERFVEYEAGEDCIYDTVPFERSVLDSEEK